MVTGIHRRVRSITIPKLPGCGESVQPFPAHELRHEYVRTVEEAARSLEPVDVFVGHCRRGARGKDERSLWCKPPAKRERST
jgi:hypothetical protein